MSSARRLTGFAAAVAALGIVLTGCFPAKPPPPPPKFKLAAGLWRTAGVAPGAVQCHVERYDAAGVRLTDQYWDPPGARYVQVAATDSEFVTSGCLPWVKYDGSEQLGGPTPVPCVGNATCIPRRSFADGDYIVGHDFPQPATGDISYGIVSVAPTMPPTGDCLWARLSNFTGDPGTVLESGGYERNNLALPAPNLITLHEGEGIRVEDCGGLFWWGTS
jgi:hypothetical protein